MEQKQRQIKQRLQQLAKDESQTRPIASETVLSNFYVDDWITGRKGVYPAIKRKQHVSKCRIRPEKIDLK